MYIIFGNCIYSRLLTLFRMKRRFRDVFGTAVILYPRLVSAMIVLLLTYYFFAIIGMECFHNVVLFECCKYGLHAIFCLCNKPTDILFEIITQKLIRGGLLLL